MAYYSTRNISHEGEVLTLNHYLERFIIQREREVPDAPSKSKRRDGLEKEGLAHLIYK